MTSHTVKSRLSACLLMGIFFFSVPKAFADMGQIHASSATISESSQKAIILHNGKEEVLILGTDLESDRKTGILRFIPFPSDPRISRAPDDMFRMVAETMKKHRLQFLMASKGGAPQKEGVELKLHATIGAHDMTVIRVNDPIHFRKWANGYFDSKGLPKKAQYADAEKIVDDYVKRGISYFVLDYVEVNEKTRFVEPVVFRFASADLYYPLKTSNTFGGKGSIEIVLLLPGSLCKPSLGGYDTCLGLPAFGQHVAVSTSAAIPYAELTPIYPEAKTFFAGRQVFMQMVSYRGDYSFDRDIFEDVGKSLPRAYEYIEQHQTNRYAHLLTPIVKESIERAPDENTTPPDPRCVLQPDPGPCKGLFEKYHFDRAQGMCRKFFYGGCQGVVPFDSMEECLKACLNANQPQ